MGRRGNRKGLAALEVSLFILSIFAIAATVGPSAAEPIYMNGDQVTVKIYETGSFVVNPMDFPSRFYDISSSYWSFNIDGQVTSTYNVLTIDHVVTPVREMPDGSIKVQYILGEEVLIDVTYREAGAAAKITVTMINIGPGTHKVGVRFLYDLRDKTITPPGQSPVTTEWEYLQPTFPKVDIYEGAQRKGVASIGTNYKADPPSRLVFGQWSGTVSADWHYKVNQSRDLGDEPTMLLFWEDMDLPSGGSVDVVHYFGKDVPTTGIDSDDLRVESVSVDPADAYIGKTRTIWAVVQNFGTAKRTVEVDFIITDEEGHYIANGSARKDLDAGLGHTFEWSYAVRKVAESRAIAVVDPSMDADPGNNYAISAVIARPSPYRVHMVFDDTTRIDYISIESGKTAKSSFIVENLGTVEDTVTFSTSSLPDKWTVAFNRSGVLLAPGESQDVNVEVKTSKENDYYNFGIDVIGRSQGGSTSDKILLFISFSDIIAKGGGNTSIGGNVTPVPTDPDPDPTPPDPFIKKDTGDSIINITPVQLVSFMIGSIMIFIVVVAVYQIFIIGSKMSMKNILKDLYRNLYKVDTSDAYRKAIFKAYKKMCEEIATYGHERAESITPKEFEMEIRKHLPIDKKHLHTLTRLFEEARYSDHAFNEVKKKKALKALKGIIISLENVTTFEEVPEKRSWFRKNT